MSVLFAQEEGDKYYHLNPPFFLSNTDSTLVISNIINTDIQSGRVYFYLTIDSCYTITHFNVLRVDIDTCDGKEYFFNKNFNDKTLNKLPSNLNIDILLPYLERRIRKIKVIKNQKCKYHQGGRCVVMFNLRK